MSCVSIHAPVRGATRLISQHGLTAWFQSTLPCGERPASMRVLLYIRSVSIHAPVRGATYIIMVFAQLERVSIHAPVRGATVKFYHRKEINAVSIHAPVRGATAMRSGQIKPAKFQSTLPCGERPRTRRSGRSMVCFNPRSRAGSDAASSISVILPTVSIHAPVRGATFSLRSVRRRSEFQSTLPCGERPAMIACLSTWLWFQSTLPCGERQGSNKIVYALQQVSIHAPVRGATRRACRKALPLRVSIHAPVRGATK